MLPLLLLPVVLMPADTGAKTAPGLIRPPFVRTWTVKLEDSAQILGVQNGVAFYKSQKGLGALDVKSGAVLWETLHKEQISRARLVGTQIIAATLSADDSRGDILAVSTLNRTSQKLASCSGGYSDLFVAAGRIYCLENSGSVKCLNLQTGGVIWSKLLASGGRSPGSMGRLAATPAGVYVAMKDSEYGLNPANGQVRWHHKSEYAGLYPPIIVGNDVITKQDGAARLNLVTGKPVWHNSNGDSSSAVAGNVIIGVEEGGLTGRDVRTGKQLWSKPVKDPTSSYSGDDDALQVTDDKEVWFQREPDFSVTRDGKILWEARRPYTGNPVYADGTTLITSDHTRILGYRHGKLPALPEQADGRKAAAEKLAQQFDRLDDAERARLANLGQFVFRPLLGQYVKWAAAWNRNPSGPNGTELYNLLTDSPPVLDAAFSKQDTRELVAAVQKLGAKSEWRGSLERILAHKGDPDAYIPMMLQSLHQQPAGKQGSGEALDAVAHSPHPLAVKFMLAALANPKAPEEWRAAAFQHLAGTGGAGSSACRPAKGRPCAGMVEQN